MVACLLWERLIQPFHLRDRKVCRPHEVPVGERHCIFIRYTVVLLRASAGISRDDEILLLKLSEVNLLEIVGFAEISSVLLLWTTLFQGEAIAILKLWRVVQLRCYEISQGVSLETGALLG